MHNPSLCFEHLFTFINPSTVSFRIAAVVKIKICDYYLDSLTDFPSRGVFSDSTSISQFLPILNYLIHLLTSKEFNFDLFAYA